jgi:Site-specific recombinase XerD
MADLDLRERTVLVRSGKGSKDRYVPFSQAALAFLQKYLDEARPELVKTVPLADHERVFLRKKGTLTKAIIWRAFAATLEKAALEKGNRSVHSIRHSCAIHLPRYTHVQADTLKRVFKTYHPRENELYADVDETYRAAAAELKKQLLRKWGKLVTMKGDS